VARVKVCGSSEAQHLQDLASERCSMPYRAPELFNVESYCMIDERTDIWVNSDCALLQMRDSYNRCHSTWCVQYYYVVGIFTLRLVCMFKMDLFGM